MSAKTHVLMESIKPILQGFLTEAVLALEAEVQRTPTNAEAWRFLGTVHAENDDDRQVCVYVPSGCLVTSLCIQTFTQICAWIIACH